MYICYLARMPSHEPIRPLFRVQVKLVFLEQYENLLEMCWVLLPQSNIDDDVVEVDNHKDIKERAKNAVHQPHRSGQVIKTAEWQTRSSRCTDVNKVQVEGQIN